MSTRWYPLWQKGNPQLRVFLPNFWMKVVKTEHKQPDNVVTFQTSMEMTEYDIKNYLTKIYQLPVVDVRSRIRPGKTKRDLVVGYITKQEDEKIAYVTLPKDVKFTYPDIFPTDAEDKKKRRDDEKALDSSKEMYKKYLEHSKKRRGLPGWYSL